MTGLLPRFGLVNFRGGYAAKHQEIVKEFHFFSIFGTYRSWERGANEKFEFIGLYIWSNRPFGINYKQLIKSIIMKRLILLFAFTFSLLGMSAQTVNLGEMSEKERNEYLVKLSKEVIKNFGPGYYRELTPTIEETKNEIFKGKDLGDIEGREYYRVTFPYDKTKEILDWPFSARVKIWKDTGEPFAVSFGNGYGKSFFHLSYKEWVEVGIKKNDQVKYQQADTTNFRK